MSEILKVDPDELIKVTDVMKKDADKYAEELKKMEASVGKLKASWDGIAAVAFTDNFTSFINKMKDMPVALAALAKRCDTANRDYLISDEQFLKDIKEGVMNREQ